MKSHSKLTPYLLLAPAVIWVLVFSIWPFLNTVVLAFTDARPLKPAKFIGLTNFVTLFSDERFGYALTTSLVYVLVCVPLLTFLPIWSWLFDSKGLINQSLQFVGMTDHSINFLVDRWLILLSSTSLTVWKGLGYYMVVYLAALAGVNKELHEAAALDGAGAWRRFWTVTVPAVKPAMLLISALITVSAMRIFSEIYVLTNGSGGPGGQAQSIVMLIQATGKGLRGNLGYASALSVALFFLTIGPLLLVAWINQGTEIRAALRLRKKSKAAQKAHELRLKDHSSLKETDVQVRREELAEAGASNTEGIRQ